jgi:hypothetical protein
LAALLERKRDASQSDPFATLLPVLSGLAARRDRQRAARAEPYGERSTSRGFGSITIATTGCAIEFVPPRSFDG